MGKSRLLVVDDEVHILESLKVFFRKEGYDVDTAEDGGEAISMLPGNPPYDAALVDLHLPDIDGIRFVRSAVDKAPSMPSILMTAFGSIPSAIEATKAGAFHYITKPFKLDEVKTIADRAIEFGRLQRENANLKKQLKTKYRFENIVGTSEVMTDVYRMIEKVAETDSTVLILGESGTGKELVARAIHYNSPRRDQPLVIVNCGAIPETLLESELFGHVKGAFTGAIASRPGRFALADGGSIFLDEIGEMSPNLQVKLLRVLQEHAFEPVGGVSTIRVDVRVIAATHVDLDRAMRERRFREDLYYRLNVIRVHLPPLRDRRLDIPLLLDHFVRHYNREIGSSIQGFDEGAVNRLMMYHWPGNVRELQNLIERSVILKGSGMITADDLADKFSFAEASSSSPEGGLTIPADGMDFKQLVTEYEDKLILHALKQAAWNKNRAADLLRMNRTTLIEKLKRKNLKGRMA